MSRKNPRKRKGKKRSMYEAGEGKIIRLELSRQKKKGGGSKVTPLLGTRCETRNSQQLKIARFVFRKQRLSSLRAGRVSETTPHTRPAPSLHRARWQAANIL